MQGKGIIGAIAGDIIGSCYEFRGNRTKDFNFELFTDKSHFTDDTVMTIGVANWFLNNKRGVKECLHEIGNKFMDVGYGHMFREWLKSDDPRPYGSYGNGAPMRVSPCGWVSEDFELIRQFARATAEVSHNSEEAVKASQLVAELIMWARTTNTKAEAKKRILRASKMVYRDYDFENTKPEDIRPGYKFDSSCQGCVPQSITCVLCSETYEETVRNAVSLGGDADTMACIAGSIACCIPGMNVPEWIEEEALKRLHPELREIYDRFTAIYCQ